MKLRLQEGEAKGEIDWGTWQIVLHGEAIDDRGRSVLHEVAGRTASMKTLRVRPGEARNRPRFGFHLGG